MERPVTALLVESKYKKKIRWGAVSDQVRYSEELKGENIQPETDDQGGGLSIKFSLVQHLPTLSEILFTMQ